MDDYILHYGVKGMRWGYRKATATEKRRVNDVKGASNVANPVSKGFEGASRTAGAIGNLAGRKPSKKVQKEMASMSDQELRNRINRLQMEQQYASLNPSKAQRGASFAKTLLEAGAGLAAVAGSAASVYLAVKKIRTTGL